MTTKHQPTTPITDAMTFVHHADGMDEPVEVVIASHAKGLEQDRTRLVEALRGILKDPDSRLTPATLKAYHLLHSLGESVVDCNCIFLCRNNWMDSRLQNRGLKDAILPHPHRQRKVNREQR